MLGGGQVMELLNVVQMAPTTDLKGFGEKLDYDICEVPGARASAAAKRGLIYDDAVKAQTDHLYEKVKHVIAAAEWPAFAPLIAAINTLKKERDAVILAHNYMTAEIFNCVGDYRGDSLGLAREAAKVDAKVIVQAGVHFMAETSKILSPEKTVLIPDLRAGCSLAASITGADVRLIKQRYPGLPVVTYVNTTADVKAESDICCTSANATQVVEAIAKEWGVSRVIMLPDEYLAKNVAAQTAIKIIAWKGKCEVHERFTGDDINEIRDSYPGAIILAHPECPPDVVAASDFTGSTGAMVDYVQNHKPKKVVLITECSMSDNVAVMNPDVEFIKPCNLCPHMKVISLEAIYDALLHMRHEVIVDPDVSARAKKAVDAMLAIPPAPAGTFDPNRAVPDSLELI
jgi:quinolinate synthase